VIPLWFEPLRSRWHLLQPRERVILAGGAVVALFLLGYALIWAPLQRDLTRLRASVPQARLQLKSMQAQAQQIARLRNSKRVRTDSASLLTQLDRSAQQRGLRQYITRMEPEGQDAVRVALDRVSFNTLIAWLADVQQQSGVRLDTATITAHTDAGIVSARLLLRATSP
jgi:general secretion pathway protein M